MSSDEIKYLVKIFQTNHPKWGLRIKHLQQNLYYFTSNHPYMRTYYINLEQAKKMDQVLWIPINPDYPNEQAEKYLQINLDKPEISKVIEFPTLRHLQGDFGEKEKQALNYYRHSSDYPSPEVPYELSIGYINKHLDGSGPSAEYQEALMHLIYAYYHAYADTRTLIVPATSGLFGVDIDEIIKNAAAHANILYSTQKFAVAYNELENSKIRDYLINPDAQRKRLFVIETNRSFPLEKGNGIQWVIPHGLQFEVEKIIISANEEGPDYIFLTAL